MDFLRVAHDRLIALLGWLRWLPGLLARLCLGWTYLISGYGHVTHMKVFIDYMGETLHIPHPSLNAHAAAYNELIGGALLLIGLGTRFASVSLIVVMSVAIVTAKWSGIENLDDLTFMPELLAVLLLAYLVIDGPGALSLDAVVRRLFGRPCSDDRESAQPGAGHTARA